MGDGKQLVSIHLDSIVGLDSIYYEVFLMLLPRAFSLSVEPDLTKEASLVIYEVLTERGSLDLLLEQNFCLMLNSVTAYYEEIIEQNIELLTSINQGFYITNILYSAYTDEHLTIIAEGYRVC